MLILFRSEKERKLFNDDAALQKKWGQDMAGRIRHRLDDLRASPSLDSAKNLPGRLHELTADRAGQLSIDLKHPQRLLFEAADDPLPSKADGGLDWTQVRTIRVIEVGDTHEK